MHFVQLLTLKK
jgi:hypothetical protein